MYSTHDLEDYYYFLGIDMSGASNMSLSGQEASEKSKKQAKDKSHSSLKSRCHDVKVKLYNLSHKRESEK